METPTPARLSTLAQEDQFCAQVNVTHELRSEYKETHKDGVTVIKKKII